MLAPTGAIDTLARRHLDYGRGPEMVLSYLVSRNKKPDELRLGWHEACSSEGAAIY